MIYFVNSHWLSTPVKWQWPSIKLLSTLVKIWVRSMWMRVHDSLWETEWVRGPCQTRVRVWTLILIWPRRKYHISFEFDNFCFYFPVYLRLQSQLSGLNLVIFYPLTLLLGKKGKGDCMPMLVLNSLSLLKISLLRGNTTPLLQSLKAWKRKRKNTGISIHVFFQYWITSIN